MRSGFLFETDISGGGLSTAGKDGKNDAESAGAWKVRQCSEALDFFKTFR